MLLSFIALGALTFAFLLLRRASRSPWGYAALFALVVGALALRWLCLPYMTLDYQDFLARWVQFFRDRGGFAALKYSVGNYNVPYLYFLAFFSYLPVNDLFLIKFLSIFFDFVLAAAAMLLVSVFSEKRLPQCVAFAVVLFLPTAVLNGSLWGQCDSIYAAFSLLSLYFIFKNRPFLSMVMIALSFSFKLQAVFMMPVFFVFLYTKKLRWYHLPVFPAAYVLVTLPAVIAGRPFLDTVTLYFNQLDTVGTALNYNSSSVYAFFWRYHIADEAFAAKLGVYAAFAFVLLLFFVAFLRRKRLDDRAMLTLSLLFAIGVPFLLPHMHDRYFFVADVLAVVLAAVNWKRFPLPVLVSFASLLGYHAYLKMRYLLMMDFGAAALVLVLLVLLFDFCRAIFSRAPAPPDAPDFPGGPDVPDEVPGDAPDKVPDSPDDTPDAAPDAPAE